MTQPIHRVKRYAHPRYRYVVRAKINGKWRRRYFESEGEAEAYAAAENAKQTLPVDPPPLERARSRTPLSASDAERLVASVPEWHHRFEIVPGIVTPGTYNPAFLLEKMALAPNLAGRRVLDIGASDGYFSLELRRRGAEVVAVDYRPKELHGFAVMERLSGLRFDYQQTNVYDITPEHFGRFDIVLFLGVLYHLPDMLRALAAVRSVCSGVLFIESQCALDVSPGLSAARYYPGSTLNNDFTNFWAPNHACFRDLLNDAAFDVHREETWGERYFAACSINEEPSRRQKLQVAYGLFDAAAEARKQSDQLNRDIPARAAAPIRETVAPAQARAAVTLPIQLFADRGDGFDESSALTASIVSGSRETIAFLGVDSLQPAPHTRLRIDPLNLPGLVYIDSIKLVRQRDEAVLYSAEAAADFLHVETSGGLKLKTHTGLLLLAIHADLQLYLPPIDLPPGDAYRMEITLEVEAISSAMIQRHSRALTGLFASFEKTEIELESCARRADAADARAVEATRAAAEWEKAFSQAHSALQASQAELGRLQYHREIKDREVQQLEVRLADTTDQLMRVTAERERDRQQHEADAQRWSSESAELKAHREADAEKIAALDEEVARARRFVEKSREKFAELLGELRQTHAKNAEYQRQAERDAEQLTRVRDTISLHTAVRREVEVARDAAAARLDRIARELSACAKTAASGMTTDAPLIRSIAADIHRVERASFGWKLAEQLGVSHAAKAGPLDGPAERKATALRLRRELRRVSREDASDSDTPEALARHISTLCRLQAETTQLVSAMNLKAAKAGDIDSAKRPRRSNLASGGSATRWRALVNEGWYFANYTDVAAQGADAVVHYSMWGAREGRNPNPLFFTKWYREQYTDVAADGMNPLQHYVEFGAAEGRNPNYLFSTRWYVDRNPDAVADGMNPLQHYILFGAQAGRDPHPLFDTTWYREQYPESNDLNPLQHYLQVGRRHHCSPHPLFDAKFYAAKYPNLAGDELDPLEHYLSAGGADGRDPHPDFDTNWYLEQAPDARAAGVTPLEHYLEVGSKRGIRPYR